MLMLPFASLEHPKKPALLQVPHFVAKKWHAACLESSHGGEKAGVELGRVVIDPTKSSVGPPLRFLQPEDMLLNVRDDTHMDEALCVCLT